MRLSWLWAFAAVLALAGCASVVGADFGDYTLSDDEDDGTTANGGGPGVGGNGAGPAGGAGPTIDAVGIVYAQNGVNVSGSLQSSLEPHFPSVVPVNADLAPLSGRDLAGFDAVVVANHSAWQFPDATGNAVGDFYDGGGRVVGMVGAFCTMVSLTGSFGDRFVFAPGPSLMMPDAPGPIVEQAPLFEGVGPLGSWLGCAVVPAPATVVLASYQMGAPLAAKRVVNGRTRVDINIFPDMMTPALGQLIANAIRYPE